MQLFQQLFSGPGAAPYREWLGCVGHRLEQIQLLFHVDENYYGVAVETLYDPSEGKILMVESPIVRSVPIVGRDVRSADLKSRRPLHILCVISNVGPDQIVDKAKPIAAGHDWPSFARLDSLNSETALFKEAAPEERQVVTHVLPDPHNPEHARQPLIELLETTLSTPPAGRDTHWDIVHFAGHCHHSASSPFLIMARGEGQRRCDVLPVNDLAKWLGGDAAKTRLLYLSSCRSGASAAARSLAYQGVPAVVAFRWDLPDDKAPIFAKAFYTALFRDRVFIVEAFRRAKQEVRRDFPSDPVWASPMLLIQDADWHIAAA
jgi:hypothetical protein